jgi:hypothetical protein
LEDPYFLVKKVMIQTWILGKAEEPASGTTGGASEALTEVFGVELDGICDGRATFMCITKAAVDKFWSDDESSFMILIANIILCVS